MSRRLIAAVIAVPLSMIALGVGVAVTVIELHETQASLCESSETIITALDNLTTVLASPDAFNVDETHPAVVRMRGNTADARAAITDDCPARVTLWRP